MLEIGKITMDHKAINLSNYLKKALVAGIWFQHKYLEIIPEDSRIKKEIKIAIKTDLGNRYNDTQVEELKKLKLPLKQI